MAAILYRPQYINSLTFGRLNVSYGSVWLIGAVNLPAVNSSPTGQNGRLFTDNIFRCIFMNEKFCILIKISQIFIPKGPIDNNPALV